MTPPNDLVEADTDPDNFYAEDNKDGDPFTNMGAPDAESGTGFMTGVTAFEAGWAIGEGIDKGDWKIALSGLIAFGLDAVAAVTDPIGYIASQVISWMLEHIEPAREALDKFAGNPGMVKAYAQSWTNIEQEMTKVGEEIKTAAPRETTGWKGEAADAYRKRVEELSGLYGGTAGVAHGIATLTQGMAECVNGVRIAIRDILAGIAGSLISWTIELLCTVGVAAPAVVAQATSAIARVVAKVAKLLKAIGDTLGQALTLLVALRDILDGFLRALNALEQGMQTAPA